MLLIALCLLAAAEPITPAQLQEALENPPKGAEAESMSVHIRESFPAGTDLKAGTQPPLIDKDTVAFVLEARAKATPRLSGEVNHGRGREMARLGETGFWACVERVPADAKFSYQFVVGGRRFGGGEVTMPGWSAP